MRSSVRLSTKNPRPFSDFGHRFSVSGRLGRPGYALLACLLLAVPALPQAPSSTPNSRDKAASSDDIVSRAEDAIARKDFSGALPLLEQATAHYANDYRAWYDLGFAYNQLGRRDDAISAYRHSVAANPNV